MAIPLAIPSGDNGRQCGLGLLASVEYWPGFPDGHDIAGAAAPDPVGGWPFRYSRTLKLNSKSAMYFVEPSKMVADSTVEVAESSRTLATTGDLRILSSSELGPS